MLRNDYLVWELSLIKYNAPMGQVRAQFCLLD